MSSKRYRAMHPRQHHARVPLISGPLQESCDEIALHAWSPLCDRHFCGATCPVAGCHVGKRHGVSAEAAGPEGILGGFAGFTLSPHRCPPRLAARKRFKRHG